MGEVIFVTFKNAFPHLLDPVHDRLPGILWREGIWCAKIFKQLIQFLLGCTPHQLDVRVFTLFTLNEQILVSQGVFVHNVIIGLLEPYCEGHGGTSNPQVLALVFLYFMQLPF